MSARGWLLRRITTWWARYSMQKLCGHHWHAEGFISWRCCNCGKEQDGFPLPDHAECLINRPGRSPIHPGGC